jgi:hypothetical protein
VDECLLDRSPYPIESECGREWKERGPDPNKTPVRAPGRLVKITKVQAAQAPARTLKVSPVPDAGPGGGIAMRRHPSLSAPSPLVGEAGVGAFCSPPPQAVGAGLGPGGSPPLPRVKRRLPAQGAVRTAGCNAGPSGRAAFVSHLRQGMEKYA